MTPPHFFSTPAKFGAWLEKNHQSASELWVGYYKKDSGLPSLTWPDSVDEALCFGWIDGVRKTIDDTSYMIRFTPRKPTSIWSNVNIAKVEALIALERMAPAGLAAYSRRTAERSGIYAFEQESAQFEPEQERTFRKQKNAWEFFQAQPKSYRQVTTNYVTSAKRPQTKERRLAELIACSARSERIGQFTSPSKKK